MLMTETFFGPHCCSCPAQDVATRGFRALHAAALGAPQHALPLVVVMRRDDVALGEGTQRSRNVCAENRHTVSSILIATVFRPCLLLAVGLSLEATLSWPEALFSTGIRFLTLTLFFGGSVMKRAKRPLVSWNILLKCSAYSRKSKHALNVPLELWLSMA
jgi:hypothetical protein